MQAFTYARVGTLAEAIAALQQPHAQAVAGGTELLNWMKEGIAAPQRIIDINNLAGLDRIEVDDHGLRIGALARMSDVAASAHVQSAYPAIAQALLASASPQIRNMATMGGNMMQRTRCRYFRADVDLPCNKRRPGSGCAAIAGDDRAAAIFGGSNQCIATHPSDVAVALAALDATVQIDGPGGKRSVPVADFHRLPGDSPTQDTELERGEIITAIVVPPSAAARRSHYLKVRERASYEFALVSAAVGVDLDGSRIRAVHIALGGVAARPWRLKASEMALRGTLLSDETALRGALDKDFDRAQPGRHNAFKIELAKRAVIRALRMAGERA
ncbi:MAG TPA: xanthine dehydrogenase family protein subunit M [Vineibacter sp.]|nr:xanthine dehydrogenase family protein subunit M [Vineibacter sp.]